MMVLRGPEADDGLSARCISLRAGREAKDTGDQSTQGGSIIERAEHHCSGKGLWSYPGVEYRPMTGSTDDIAYLDGLAGTLRRRSWVLELQIAHYGEAAAPVHLLM